MELELLYIDGCPSWRDAHEHLREALCATGCPAAVVRTTRVTSHGEAPSFRGSPTITLDGRDLFPGAPSPTGLACRLYATNSGVAGAPSTADLVAALAAATLPTTQETS